MTYNLFKLFANCNKVRTSSILSVLIIGNLFNLQLNATSLVNNKKDCENCFSTEITDFYEDENSIDIQLKINTISACNFALSHFSIEVPCGKISDISNSKNWKIELSSSDPTTGISGFKIDDIEGFGENKMIDSFTVNYTVTSDDRACINQIKDEIRVAYKAGTCVFYEDVEYPNMFSATLISNDISCHGGNNGSISIETTGGTSPFTYLWNTGNTSENISGLRSGDYSVQITDSTGAIIELNTTLTQPDTALFISSKITAPSCGQNDGQITLNINGGTSPIKVNWNNGNKTSTLIDIYSGKYSVQVIDSNGCSTYKTIEVTEETDLNVSLTPNFLECYQQGDGTVKSNTSGGQEPYSYQWSNNDTTENLSLVNSGSYTLTVTDAKGCKAKASTYVGIKKMSLSTSVLNPTCFGDDDGELGISNVNYGSAPYTYLWNNGNTSSTLTNITSGKYKVTVTDANGCESTRTINLADRQQLIFNHTISREDCSADGSDINLHLSASGGTPNYNYLLNDSSISTPFKVDNDKEYNISVIDALGCETNKNIVINSVNSNFSVKAEVEQPACGGNLTGNIQLISSGGEAPYNFIWSDGFSGDSRDKVPAGTYHINATDANGCSNAIQVSINSATVAAASILAPSSFKCESSGNKLYSSSSNVETYTWEFIDNDNWNIESSTENELTYYSGNDSATIIYSIISTDGCFASDTLVLNCSNSDNNQGEDTDDVDITDSIPTIDYNDDCFYSEITKTTPLDNNCYEIEMWTYTNGECLHELSHLSVGIDNATINWVDNSRNWKTEMNSTDPRTGIYGFKVDDISGFGQVGSDKFKTEFEVCFHHSEISDYFPETITVAYKAANGYSLQHISTNPQTNNQSGLNVNVFPNPFKEESQLTIESKTDTNVNIEVFDLTGNKVETIYMGNLEALVQYRFKITGGDSSERIFFYKVISNKESIQGKLLKTN